MPQYHSPGVYVEEQDTGARPIQVVGTTTAGLVGAAPLAGAHSGEARRISSWAQFQAEFIGDAKESTNLANAVNAFFLNGGSVCYVVNLPDDQPVVGTGKGLELLDRYDEIAMIVAPGRTDAATHKAMIDCAETLGDRVALLDGPQLVDDVEQLTRPASGEADNGPKPGMRSPSSLRGYAAFYYPWIRARDAVNPKRVTTIPPSAYAAGICARTDIERGVHKAPANVVLRHAEGLTHYLTKSDQSTLNPAGVNCIRSFTPEGIVLWGARTVAPPGSNWTYLNVRRLFNMIEESIERSTRWVVFEPNDRPLWKAIRRDVSQFLTLLWRQGALMGATPQQAFFVKCDEETNTQEVIDAGQVVIVVGIAPVKPAEFVIFRIGQAASGTTVDMA